MQRVQPSFKYKLSMNRAHNCKSYKGCGGCQLTNLSYEEQLSFKMKKVISEVGRFCHVDEIIPAENNRRYRNKLHAVFTEAKNGNAVCGLWQSSSGTVKVTEDCVIENKKALEVVKFIRTRLRACKITVFSPEKRRGLLRHIEIRTSSKGDMGVLFVLSRDNFEKLMPLAKEICEKYSSVKSVAASVNSTEIPVFCDSEYEVILGVNGIYDTLCGIKFFVSPTAFFQINHDMTEKLYKTAIECAALTEADEVLDAYCGIGTIGLIAAKKCKKVTGVEINPSSVNDALRNALENGIENYEVIRTDCTEFMEKTDRDFSAVLCDPPRAGLSKRFTAALTRLAPERIVYISCNPETLSRDLAVLCKSYRAEKIIPFDMFPHTRHCECVAVLRRK